MTDQAHQTDQPNQAHQAHQTHQPKPRPLAGLSKSELRALCATHFRTATAREAQGKEFILRAKAGIRTAGKTKHDEWRKDEGFKPKFTSMRTPGHSDPLTRKRWSYTENK